MKLRLPNKLIAALMSAMSAATFATLATGTTAYGEVVYTDFSSPFLDRTNNVYYSGQGQFEIEAGVETSLILTLDMSRMYSWLNQDGTNHDYVGSTNLVSWNYSNATGSQTYTWGINDITDRLDSYSGSPAVIASSANVPVGNPLVTYDALNALADSNHLVTLTFTSNAQGVSIYNGSNLLASATGIGNNDASVTTGFAINFQYVTSVNLQTASTLDPDSVKLPQSYAAPFVKTRDESVGRIVFMGDSITHGVQDMTWRWGLFKTFTDNGIENQIAGPLGTYNINPNTSDYNSNATSTPYGGAVFNNVHYAKSSGRAYEMISGARYGVSVGKVGDDYNVNTGVIMIGTNDILSDTKTAYLTKFTNLLGGTVSYDAASKDYTWTRTESDAWGNMGTILNEMNLESSDVMYVMSIPTWAVRNDLTYGPTATSDSVEAAHHGVEQYNMLLKQWTEAYNAAHTGTVKYVEINQGLVDVTDSVSFKGYTTFFRGGSDQLHPTEQGSLIIAGNLAHGMGIGGRTAGLHRAASGTAGTVWDSAATQLTIGTEAQSFATDAFHTLNGYTIDFNGAFGDGATDGWMTKDNALSITVGDGTNTGTLKLSEGYISWGDTIIFCRDNSAEGNENIRIAYHNGVVADNVAGGYYVWLGDMLIGQGLNSTSGNLNGITLSATGAEGTIRNLTWSDTAYAPTTNLITSTTHAYYAEQDVTGPVVVAADGTATIDAETVATSFSMGANSTLNVNKNVTVQTGATITTTDSMHINLAEGTSLTFAGTDLGQNDANKAKRFSHLLDAATGDGTVVLTGNTYVQLGTAGIDKDHVFKTNYLVKGGTLALQDWTHTAGAHAWIVGKQENAGSLSVENGNLWVSNGQILRVVKNGTLNVSGELQLGMYSAIEGSFNGNLELRGGETTVGSIRFNSDLDTSAVKMSGGTLRITGENAFADTFSNPVVTITGGTLKAEGNSWVFNRTATIGSEEGAITIVTDKTHSVTLGASGTTTTLAGDIYVGAPGMAAMSEDAGGSEAQSGNLVLNGAYNGGAHSVNVLSGSSLAFGANLAVADGSSITINGETGAYVNLTPQSAALPTRVALGDAENWLGTVKVTNVTIGASDNLSALGNANSTVELTGVRGFDSHWASDANGYTSQTANIRLTDDGETHAWVYNGGGAGSLSYNMINEGKWSGEGTFEVALNNIKNGFKYTGDISEWTGTFLMTSGTAKLTFSGAADTVNATIAKNGGTLDIVADTDVTFNKTVAADSLSVTGHEVTLGNLAHSIGTITIGDGGTVTTTKTDSSDGFTNGAVNVNAGGTLKLVAYDALGWGNNGTSAINMTGTSAKHATLAVSDKQTFSSTLNLNGYTDVINGEGSSDNKGLELFADGDHTGTIVATGTGNTISTGVFLRSAGTITTNAGAELTISGDVRDGAEESAALVKAGAGTLILSGANTFTGDVNVNAGTLKVGSNTALGAIGNSRTITVNNGGTLDVNGKTGTDAGYAVTLNGGILTNTGADIAWGDRQLITVLTLEADSTVNGTKRFGMFGPNGATTTLNLGEHTLEKTGTNTFTLVASQVTGTGKLKVTQGIVDIYDYTVNNTVQNAGSFGANIEMAGGSLQGGLNLGKDITITTTRESTISPNSNSIIHTQGHYLTLDGQQTLNMQAEIEGDGGIIKSGDNTVVLTRNNTFTGDVTVNSGTLKMGSGTALGARNDNTTRLITINKGGTIDLNDQCYTAYSYTLAGGSLINNGSNGTNNGAVQTSALTLTQDSFIGGTGRFSILASNGNDSAINLNGKTLTKTGTNTVRMHSAMISPGTLVVKGGSLEFTRFQNSKNWSTVDADITISGDTTANTQGTISGTFNLAGGHTITSEVANGIVSATITTQGATTLATTGDNSSLSLTGGLNVGGTLTNTGALNLSGAVTVNTANLWNYKVKAPAEGNTYSYGDNGYLQDATLYLVKNSGGTVDTTGATFSGQTVNNDGAGNLTFTATDNSTYYVNKGNLTYDSETMGTATNLYIAEGQSLTASVNPGAKKLVGSGTFLYTNTSTAPGITVDSASNWTGTVVLRGLNKNSGYSLNNYGNAASWVHLIGVSGWDTNWNSHLTANLILENNSSNAAWTYGAGATSPSLYYMSVDGKVKGDGTMLLSANNNQGLSFTNDISGWTGAITSAQGTKYIKFSGKAAEVNATISRTGGTMKVIMERDVTFNRDVTIDNLTLNKHTVTVGSYNETPATMTVSGVISNVSDSVTESLTLDGSGTLVLNGANTFTGDVTVNGGTLKLGNGAALGASNTGASDTRKITVTTGGALDINGQMNGNTYAVTLTGGTLTNSGSVADWNKRNLVTSLVVEDADSYVYVESDTNKFGLIASNWNETTLTLNGHDLIKTGEGTYMLTHTTVTGSGKLIVRKGTLEFRSNGAHGTLSSNIVMDGGTVDGSMDNAIFLGKDVSVTAKKAGSAFSAKVNTNGHTLTVDGAAALTLSGIISGDGGIAKTDANAITLSAANTFTGGTTIKNGALIATNSNALQSSVVTFADLTAEQAPHRVVAFKTGATYDSETGTLTGGTAINGKVAGLSGTRGTVEAATLTINTAADTEYTYSGELNITNITKQGAGTQILQGTDVALGDVDMQGGTLNFISGTATTTVLYSGANSLFSIGSASGEGTAVVTATRIELGNMNNDAANHASSDLQVFANGTLVVTGSSNGTNTGAYKSDSLILGEWNADSAATVSGNLLALGADLLIGDTGNSHKVSFAIDGGTVAVKGVNAGALGMSGNLEMTLTNGGKLILGADGYYTREVSVTANPTAITTITSGTIGISADTVDINKGMTITDATFDTKKYAFNTAGNAIAQAEDATGGSLTVNGDITGESSSNLHKVGVGTLTLNGSNAAFTGNVDVQGGTLVVKNHLSGNTLTLSGDGTTATFNNGDAAANGTTFSGNIVANAAGGTLNVNGTAPLTANTISITAGTTLNFDQQVTLSSTSRPEMLYNNDNKAATYINFNGGYAYSGSASGYALLAGKNVHITMGGTTDLTGKSIAVTGGASLTLKDGAILTVAQLYNSKDAGMNGTINVGSNATLAVTGTSDSKVSHLNLANGSTTSFNGTTLVENLTVDGAKANLAMKNNGKALTIQKLLGGSGNSLELYCDNQTANLYTVNMGDASLSYTDDNLFSGNLWVTSHSMQGSTASSAINMAVKAKDVLKNATVNLTNWTSNYNNTRVIMSLENDAKVAGINSANTGAYEGAGSYIRSGAMTKTAPGAVADMASTGDTAHTLEITGSGEYSTNAHLMANVNLTMSGEGTQTFNGDLSAFNGMVKANNGRLVLANAADSAERVTMRGIFVYSGVLELSGGHYAVGSTRQDDGLFADGHHNLDGSLVLSNGADLLVDASANWWRFQVNSGDNGGVYIKDTGVLTAKLQTNKHGSLNEEDWDSTQVTIKALDVRSETGARIANTETVGKDFAVDQSYITITDADYTIAGKDAHNVQNKMLNTALTNGGTGTLTVKHENNTLVGVHAENGAIVVEHADSSAATLKSIKATGADITLDSLHQAASVSLNELVIGKDKKVIATHTVAAAQTRSADPSDAEVFANIEVTGTQDEPGRIEVGMGGTTEGINLAVNATEGSVDYSAIPGNVLNLNGGSLTLSTLADNDYRINLSAPMVAQLESNIMIEVMSGIGALTVNDFSLSADAIDRMNAGDMVVVGSAASVFGNNFYNQDAQVLFRTDAGGTGTLLVTPEPATTALSLLALAALASRRKRK